MSSVPSVPDTVVPRLYDLLDEAELRRTHLDRRIRRLKRAVRAVEDGRAPPGLAELLDESLPDGSDATEARPTPRLVAPAPPAVPPGAAEPAFATRLGVGLGPHVEAPTPAPPAPPANLPSVDVGALGRMTAEELDGLPFGVVTLDHRGRVVAYNDTESRLAGLPKDRVIGRHFFREVAPCARVKDFEGRFREVAEGRSRLGIETFDFVFHFASGAQRVLINVSPARLRGRFHVSMLRR